MFAPLVQSSISGYGWTTALLLPATFALIVPVLAAALRGGDAVEEDGPTLSLRQAVRGAFGHGSYLLLVSRFFVCGFHVAFNYDPPATVPQPGPGA